MVVLAKNYKNAFELIIYGITVRTFSVRGVVTVFVCERCYSCGSQLCCASEMQLLCRMSKVTLGKSLWTTCFQRLTKERHSPTQNTALSRTSSM